MADNRLNEIDELLAKTTPGPWPGDYVYSAVRHIARNCDHIESKTDPDFAWHRYDDAEFIAASRTLVPELLAEVRRLRAENQQFQEELLKAGDAWRESQAENQRLDKDLTTYVAERNGLRAENQRLREALLFVVDRLEDRAENFGYDDAYDLAAHLRSALGVTSDG